MKRKKGFSAPTPVLFHEAIFDPNKKEKANQERDVSRKNPEQSGAARSNTGKQSFKWQ
ncbi:hypothetical protein [Effusibacillus consociatus]|uniref:Uncharacterized protein n=1 Tax=Effusibacillus consociatus TaxID=1117041 RepID=A0ABV9Q0G0_9BACL